MILFLRERFLKKKVDEELQHLLNNQSINENKFHSIKSVCQSIQLIFKDSQNLSNMINFTSNLADNVSNKVRQLDVAKGRVSSCIKRVTDILDLKACTDGVTEALNEEDYETAANHIHKYLSLDKDSLRLKSVTTDLAEKNFLDQSFNLLQESKNKLQAIVNDKYDQALKANDVPQMERFFKIFPLIGLAESGIEKFSNYLCAQINQSADKNFNVLIVTDRSDERWSVMFADSLILLFERVARVIEAYQPVIEASYGYGKIFLFVKNIQKECDKQSVRILNKFKEARQLNNILRNIQLMSNFNRNPNPGQKFEDKFDPRDLDELLTEITLISARSELYKNFITKSIMTDLNGIQNQNTAESLKTKINQVNSFINSCDLQCAIQELIGQYSLLENFFMTENINKAIQMDTITKDSLTSSVVDDVFFIIKKCIKRSLVSDNVDGCCAMFNNCSTVLESIYKDHFYSKLKLGYPSGFDLTQAIKSRFQNSEQIEKQKVYFLVTLNNIEKSIECVTMIKKSFEDYISKLFNQETQSSKDKLNTCLNDLNSVGNRLKELLEYGFNQLNSNEIRPRIKQWCEQYSVLNHKITEDEFNQNDSNDPFIQNFVKNLDQMLNSLKDSLSEKNKETFTSLLASETAILLEKSILKCSFSKYGGVQLDKEIRFLINYLTSQTSWSTREKFARLSQISILLSLENLNELFEYWNSPLAITWRLTPNEIRQLLLLRSDFKAEEVRNLKL
ncbi:unnamed protein product [Brachionus calyciflorus]|uniref:Conserved oligomeric Golgi complex subunit 4 n=1 Tax=Brachionus calyciflorus TaxID=104777 RepID=A0A813M3R2_9BILA|nr:unnamed protein product [Brachionus calyciflorus]